MLIRLLKFKGLFTMLLIVAILMLSLCTACTAVSSSYLATIVVDAGHGGMDGGVVGSKGVTESEINLSIAKSLAKSLRREGYNVVMTREDSSALGSSKKADMNRRREIIEKCNADMVISVHVNKFSDTSRRGAQVFYDDGKLWAREGDIMQRLINEYINKVYGGRHDYEAIGGDYFMTKCANVPSLIVECGFISNAEDEALLLSNAYQDDIARVITMGVNAIMSY